MSITRDPEGICELYLPFSSVVKLKVRPPLSVIMTLTPSIPGSPVSRTRLLFKSLNIVPVRLPNARGVGDWVGDEVGSIVGEDAVGPGVAPPEPVGDTKVGLFVGEPVGLAVGDPVGLVVGGATGPTVGDLVGDLVGRSLGDSDGDSLGATLEVGDAVGTGLSRAML